MKKLLIIGTLALSGLSFGDVTGQDTTQTQQAQQLSNCCGPAADRGAAGAGCNKGDDLTINGGSEDLGGKSSTGE